MIQLLAIFYERKKLIKFQWNCILMKTRMRMRLKKKKNKNGNENDNKNEIEKE